MTQENTQRETTTTEANAVHHTTKKAADTSLAKKAISPDSHRAVHEGRISLEEARELGREGSPFGPAPKTISKNDRSRSCLCLCGNRTNGGRFRPGHDMRMVTLAKAHVRGEAEPNEEQMAYLVESGKLERAHQRVAEEEAKRQEAAAKKAEAQRKKEGDAEAKKRNAESGEKS